MNEILKYWGLEGEVAEPMKWGQSAWEVGNRYVLKFNKNADSAARNIRLSQLLRRENIPIASYIPTLGKGMTVTAKQGGEYSLMQKISGLHPDFFAHPHLALEMGQSLGYLHKALAQLEGEFTVWDNEFIKYWHEYILSGLDDSVPADMVEYVQAHLTKICPKLPKHPIHRDVHPQNVLFDDGRLVAWLDFDLSERNVRLFDLAYLPAGLIVDKFSNKDKVEIWRKICQNLLKGYNEVNPLTFEELGGLDTMMIAVELLFVSYWRRQENHAEAAKALELAKWIFYANTKNGL
jgi:Ser/Thr protein kinase RdoA (MazF antagonist)